MAIPCTKCGYDLTGLVRGPGIVRCPECGDTDRFPRLESPLRCEHCKYDLTGLVRGPELVRCPECGDLTDHDDGKPLPRPRPDRWWRLSTFVPGAVCVAIVLLGVGVGGFGDKKVLTIVGGFFAAFGFLLAPLFTFVMMTDWDRRRNKRVRGSTRALWLAALVISLFATLIATIVVVVILAMIHSLGA